MSEISQRLQNLSPQKRALLAKRFNLQLKDNPIEQINNYSKVPLSYSQEHIWLLEEIFPKSAVNNIAGIATYKGKFDLDYFYKALELVLRRHTALRMSFYVEDGNVYQKIIEPKLTKPLIVSLEDLDDENEKNAKALAIMQQEAHRPFDLQCDMLLRSVICRFSINEYRIMVCMHHIASDGWSTALLLRDALHLYQCLYLATPLPVIDSARHYADFALWQRMDVNNKFQKEIAFWKNQLQDLAPELPLPFDYPRQLEPSYRGNRIKINFPQELGHLVKKFSHQNEVTPFMFFMTAYSVLLHRYTQEEDFAIGVPIAGRDRKDLENIVGCFLNIVVFRIDASNEPTFKAFLQRIKQLSLKTFQHSAAPFEKVVKAVSPERNINRSPLFQVAFSFEHEPKIMNTEQLDISLSFEELNIGIARYDLSLEIVQAKDEGHFYGWVDYKTDLFEETTIENFIHSFLLIIEEVLYHPEINVGQINLLTNDERKKIITKWNQTNTDYPRDITLHDYFSQVVREFPNKIALAFHDRKMTYTELDAEANRVANNILSLNLKDQNCIALYIERSIETIVGLLGILKAGFAYLPLDIADPLPRIVMMLQDAKVDLVVTNKIHRHIFDKYTHLTTLIIDDDLTQNTLAPSVSVKAQDVATVMFTSGSTGIPKGVMVTHRNIMRLVKKTNYAHFGPEEIGLWLAPLAFDASLFEIWGPLLNGSCLAIAPAGLLSFDQIGNLIRHHQITTLWLTAGLFQAIVEEDVTCLSSLKQLLTGGDVLPKAQVEKFLRDVPSCKLINGYGPTEGTTFSCYHNITLNDLTFRSIPIGKPISNTTAYILDRYLQPVPIGVIGELYLGGDGITQGYINNAKLTEQKFIRDPFNKNNQSYLYKSGDRARYLDEGVIEFHGRADTQVKIRGYRIEIGEIETSLASHKSVKEVKVIVSSSDKKIIAYVILQPHCEINSINWRSYLSEKLPDYMIPAIVIPVEKFPLNRNGKIDVNSLPAIQSVVLAKQEPIGEIEKILAQLWQELLQINNVTRDDNFFALGGDSIRAVQLISRARQRGYKISTKEIFMNQTLKDLAHVVKPINSHDRCSEIPKGEVPLTAIQRWFFNQSCENYSHWNQWLLVPISKQYTYAQVKATLKEMSEHFDIFRLRFARGNQNEWKQMLSDDRALEIEHLTFLPSEANQQLLYETINLFQQKLNITQGPLFRVGFIEGINQEHNNLLLVAHHLIIDQVSWYIFMEVFQNLMTKKNSKLLPDVSFTEWSRSVASLYSSHQLEKFNEFWNTIPWQRCGKMPVDFLHPSNYEYETKSLIKKLTKNQTKQLKEAQKFFSTRMDDFLIMALGQALSQWTAAKYVQLDNETNGRQYHTDLDLSHTLGWFTVIYPVFLNTSTTDFSTYIKQVKEQLRLLNDSGFGLFLLQTGVVKTSSTIAIPFSDLIFNYLGEVLNQDSQIDYGFSLEDTIQSRDPKAKRRYKIEITARIVSEQLEIVINYSSGTHNESTIDKLFKDFLSSVHALTHYCLTQAIPAYTPSDFPLSALNQTDLDQLFNYLKLNKTSVEDIYALTPLQEGLLFHALSSSNTDDYLVQFCCKIHGPLNMALLKAAWQEVIRNHPALRSSFHHEFIESPVQLVRRDPTLQWNAVDLSNEENIDRSLSEFIKQDRKQKFDLSKSPLMRFHLIDLSEQEWYLLWTYHHIILDGWSMSNILREVLEIYKAKEQNTIYSTNTRLYRDFIALVQNQDKQQALLHWKNYLADVKTATPLPVKSNSNNIGDCPVIIKLEASTTKSLMEQIKIQHMTLASVIQGIWALILASFSSGETILFGTTVSGRHTQLEDLESGVGLFINTIPQKFIINRHNLFSDWLTKNISEFQFMNDFCHSSIVDIQGVSHIPRGQPLFESVVVVENYPLEKSSHIQIGQLTLSHFEVIEKIPYPVTLVVLPHDELTFKVFYDQNRFSPNIINKIAQGILTILKNSSLFTCSVESILNEISSLLANPNKANDNKHLESKLTAIWCELLGIPQCGLEDNFFELGGHSLILMKMRNKILEHLSLDIALADLLQHHTLRQLTQFISAREHKDLYVKS